MLNNIASVFRLPTLRNKILFTLGALLLYRLVTHIPVPGADTQAMFQLFNSNQILGAFSLLTGGGLRNFSIILMGLSPYINASIIMQLMAVISPRLEALSKEGEQGRQTINRYTRWLTYPLALLQSYGFILLLNSSSPTPIIADTSFQGLLPVMLVVSAGTIFLMWLGEIMTEKGIGNGISLLIFAGIIASMPEVLGQVLGLAQVNPATWIPFALVVVITLVITYIIVLVTEAQRNIPINYAGREARGADSIAHIPIRVNQAGMIPIIFAVSLMTFPVILARFLVNAKTPWLADFANQMINQFNSGGTTYMIIYFFIVLAFTFFYVSIIFNPEQVAENIQRRGGFITGMRPGRQTAAYLAMVSNRITLYGGIFIGFVAIFPLLIGRLFNILAIGSVPLLIGGAGLLIVVGVVLEVMRQIKIQMVMQDYEKLY
ncbi:MAG: preprotein translocase subunit SecY [Candidatus Abawacabacteria bacterium RIFCSPHIGHO2_01_FULL_46_8]|uniref:Protein translocase subunit SecY n=1 Tax=Candidatus Abawacabacteria bacterium RIFCSPHIGHO2_01_FULL_46_8 TaxID=1817815 RepID=A0A1F4XMV6_9BACT|nr:MAG: preprotein translocase subunit SecY [Candidatus Abawacabacteria bacterium RIFCSPHIGHO2_01_FULL_46_8]